MTRCATKYNITRCINIRIGRVATSKTLKFTLRASVLHNKQILGIIVMIHDDIARMTAPERLALIGEL
ncbi:hypothetical protein XFUD_09020 [Xylella fastidiosa]|nr:hypothetical protein XFUD_09020 [Xylella fastidiosa]ETE33522.1 hypothetical protein B398_04690 [Xylella fastidiosa 32]OCA57473.1 hypothetical protein AA93_08845 [Xylella fastidiosa subsp. pauca 11399]OJZ71489.1 hypothetical protein B375_0204405 [Xylella fastidiosa 6c]ALR02401.1 hypothetical protein OY18_09490 [Xylella fastidiosa]